MPDTEPFAAQRVAERIRQSIDNRPFVVAGGAKTIRVTASIGVATAAANLRSGDTLFKNADKAMYEAKKAGRNCVRIAA